MPRLRSRTSSIGALAVLLLTLASCSLVSGPVTGPGSISMATGFDLGLVGYERSEYFVAGLVPGYKPTAPLTGDGRWTAAPLGPAAGFKTRFVVYRPTDPAKFNGTVVVEWLNVTAGVDLANDWVMSHNELIRNGAAWVGVSAQAVGVNALERRSIQRDTARSPTPATASPTPSSARWGRRSAPTAERCSAGSTPSG